MKRIHIRSGAAMSAVSSAFLWACSGVFTSVQAALPKINTPSGGGIGGASVQDGDWIALMGAYFKQGFAILGLVLAAAGFIAVVIGSLSNYKSYSEGRTTFGELKQFMIVGVIVIAFIVLMINYAAEVLA